MTIRWGTAGLLFSVVTVTLAQTPVTWLAHDMNRPRPPVVVPGKLSLPVAPPSDAIVLFDGKDLTKWESEGGAPARWKVRDGAMESVPLSGYLFTKEKFGDVQLHVEWAAPLPAKGRGQGRGNSGVFLMGLYEVQVLDSYNSETYPDGQAGAIYGQYPPLVNACLPPGEWQSYDIVFRRPRFHADGTLARAARMTVVHNGVLIQDNSEIWGPTAWLQRMPYTNKAEELHLSLQDHGNPVRYRNIWLRKLSEPRDWAPPVASDPAKVTLTNDQLQKFVGNYSTLIGEFGSIERVGDELRLHMKTGQVIDLVPRSETEFALRWTAAHLVFNVKKDGNVGGFVLNIGGEQVPVNRTK